MPHFRVAVKPTSVAILAPREPLVAGGVYDVVCQSRGGRPAATLRWFLDGKLLINATRVVVSGDQCLPVNCQ